MGNNSKRTRTRTPVDFSLVEGMSGDEIKALIQQGGEKAHRAFGTMLNAVQEKNTEALKGDEEYQRRLTRFKDAQKNLKAARVAVTPDAQGKLPIDTRIDTLEAQLEEARREREIGIAAINDGSDDNEVGHLYQSMVDAKTDLDGYVVNLTNRGIQVPATTEE